MGIPIQGYVTGNGVEADSNNRLLVNTPTLAASAGYVNANSMLDTGTYTGAPLIRSPKISSRNNTSISFDAPLVNEIFNYPAQNTADYKYLSNVSTTSFNNGFALLNSGSSTASGQTLLQSYRSIPIYGVGGMIINFSLGLNIAPITNFQAEFGIFSQSGTAPYTPTDGVYFRFTSAGLIGVTNFNGTETTTATLIAAANLTLNVQTFYEIRIHSTRAEFWTISSSGVFTLLGYLNNTGNNLPFLSGALPIAVRHNNTGTTSSAVQIKLGSWAATLVDYEPNKPWAHALAGDGAFLYQGQPGGTMGSTALSVNNTAPTAAVPTNTTAALGSGLGGLFYSTATIAVTTDGIISSYQNPLGSINQQPRGMYVTGVRVDTAVITVLAGGPFILSWGLAFGHTAVSLATTESASTKAPRRLVLGIQVFPATAAVGTQGNTVAIEFTTPIYLNPGEFIQTFYRNIGTVGTSGTFAHAIAFDGYWE
jgi:hypothetical protein